MTRLMAWSLGLENLEGRTNISGEILLFDIEFARLTCFNAQFARLLKYNTEHVNSFDLRVFYSFLLSIPFLFPFHFLGPVNGQQYSYLIIYTDWTGRPDRSSPTPAARAALQAADHHAPKCAAAEHA
jgi:hypothetical protein